MSEGFSALRTIDETEWVLRGTFGLERLDEYESRLTPFALESNCVALCSTTGAFSTAIHSRVIRTHPIVVYATRYAGICTMCHRTVSG